MMFSDKVAIVAGGSTGIDLAAALTLAQRGARVAICSHDATTLEATLADWRRVLLSDRASFMTGETVGVDGGLLAGLPVRLPD